MTRINLLNHKIRKVKKLAVSKRMNGSTKNPQITKVWYISKDNGGIPFYVAEVSGIGDNASGAVKWTKVKRRAMQFHTRSGVDHFVNAYLNGRTDITYLHEEEEL